MENGIVILDFEDIPAAMQIAADLPSYTIYTFDPVLVDKISMHHLKNIQLLTWDDCPQYADLEAWSHAAAFEMEAALDLAVRDIIPDLSIGSWQHLNLFYLLMKLKWYTGLWTALANQLANIKVHLFICDKSSAYNFNSFVPSLLLIQHLKRINIEFSGFMYGAESDDTRQVPDLRGANASSKTDTILTHLPTCFYDIYHFNAEMQSTGKNFINIKSKHYDMPVHTARDIPLIDQAEVLADFQEPIKKKVALFHTTLAAKLDELLAPYIGTPSYRTRQVDHIAAIYTAQLVTFFMLNRHFQHVKPSKILMSDRDMGFHGPLVSFAENHHLPVLLLPHSKTTNDMEYRYKNIVALTHPMQGEKIRDANGRNLLNFPITYPEKFSSSCIYPAPIKKIALLLNAPSLNGIYFARYATYISDIKKMIQWGKVNHVEFSIRCKPSYSLIRLLASETGIGTESLLHSANIPMTEFSQDCDLCLMFDSPTSAAAEFLAKSIPILNPIPRPLSASEATFVNARVIPRESVHDTLLRLNGFLSDLNSFFLFRNHQFRSYLNLYQNAQPLRAYL
jgi:hypothetical protein